MQKYFCFYPELQSFKNSEGVRNNMMKEQIKLNEILGRRFRKFYSNKLIFAFFDSIWVDLVSSKFFTTIFRWKYFAHVSKWKFDYIFLSNFLENSKFLVLTKISKIIFLHFFIKFCKVSISQKQKIIFFFIGRKN